MNSIPSKRSVNFLIYGIFFISGISGLLYETVWLRMLSRIVGNTVYASSIVLSAFMLGLSLGSLYIGKSVDKRKRLLKAYTVLEIGIAISAVLVFYLLNALVPAFQNFHTWFGDKPLLYRTAQAICVFVLLVVPTFMMGATLPVLSAACKKNGNISISNMSILYGLNTLGAVTGVLISGYYTIGAWGESNTMWLGFALNLLAAVSAYFLSNKTAIDTSSNATDAAANLPQPTASPAARLVLIAYFIIGFTSFALELIWTRIFQIQIGTSIYAFSLVLAIYLLGSSLGSMVGAGWFNTTRKPLQVLAICLSFIAAHTLAGTYLYVQHLPDNPGISFSFDTLLLPFVIIFPITFLLGLSFPLVMQVYVKDQSKIADHTGKLYAMNTIGCIFGSLLCGYVFIRFLGTKHTLLLLSFTNLGLAAFLYLRSTKLNGSKPKIAVPAILVALILALGVFMPDPFFNLITKIVHQEPDKEIFYHKEGVVATTTSYGSTKDKTDRQILINGVGMTALVAETKIMSHLPILAHPRPKNVLIICFGMGTAVRSALAHSEVNVDVVELVAEEFEAFQYYHDNAKEILANPRLQTYADDGRNYLLMSNKRYDVIVLDPAPPLYSAGTVNLYTQNFFQLCKERLSENGIMCLWIPPDVKSEVQMIMRSFTSVFPASPAYTGIHYPGFYLLGSRRPVTITKQRFVEAANNGNILRDLNEWEPLFDSVQQLADLQILKPNQVDSVLQGVPILTDNLPYTEFPLWRSKSDPNYKLLFNGSNFSKKYPN